MNQFLRAAATALLFITVSLITTPATEPSDQPSVQLPPELERVLRDYEQAWSHGDAPALAKLFAEDGFVLSPGRPMMRGKAAIEEAYRDDHGAPLALRAVAFAAEGKVGYIIGAYADRAGDKDRGKFTLTLRRESSGRWLIVSDMDNGNQPRH